MSENIYLEKIHNDINSLRQRYQLPLPLLCNINEVYMGYLRNSDGNSFYYQWLALLVRIVKPNLVVELGSGLGTSTLMILSELPKTVQLVSCDLYNRLDFIPEHVLGDHRLNFYFGDDLNLNIFGNDLPIGIDLLFIDTEHTFEQISAEWNIYKHLCNPGALIILDDIRMNDMYDFWESIPYPKLDLTTECHASGFGLFLYDPGNKPNPLNAYREALKISLERFSILRKKEPEKSFFSNIQNSLTALIRTLSKTMK